MGSPVQRGRLPYGPARDKLHWENDVSGETVVDESRKVYLVSWYGGYDDPSYFVTEDLEKAEAIGREWSGELKSPDAVSLDEFDLAVTVASGSAFHRSIVTYWMDEDTQEVQENRV